MTVIVFVPNKYLSKAVVDCLHDNKSFNLSNCKETDQIMIWSDGGYDFYHLSPRNDDEVISAEEFLNNPEKYLKQTLKMGSFNVEKVGGGFNLCNVDRPTCTFISWEDYDKVGELRK